LPLRLALKRKRRQARRRQHPLKEKNRKSRLKNGSTNELYLALNHGIWL
jgi:hypothetical protein